MNSSSNPQANPGPGPHPDPRALTDRLQGAMLGAFIGDALGVGPHWYYDLTALRRDHGDWITDYTRPRHGRYHDGLAPGELSQSGSIMLLLLRSLAECGGYDEEDFQRRMDHQLLPQLDGSPYAGPGGFTNQSIRDLYQARVVEGRPWGQTGAWADTTEAAERNVLLAARHAFEPDALAEMAARHCRLTQIDPAVVAHSTVLPLVISQLVAGTGMAGAVPRLRRLMERGQLELPRHRWTGEPETDPGAVDTGFFDAVLVPATAVGLATNPHVRIEPAWRIAQVHGLACAFHFVLPSAYYLAARFSDDFEGAVLHAINGGGQNMSRACLAGALVGAQVGRSGIPSRLVGGLRDHDEILELISQVAADAVGDTGGASAG